MQSATQADAQPETGMVTAEALREMTVTPETLFVRQKANILDALMSSMVKVATENGASGYSANLHAEFDPKLLSEVTDELQKLGYKTATKAITEEKLGSFIQLTINW